MHLGFSSMNTADDPAPHILAKTLEEAGFDITSPEFWQGGYDVLTNMITTLEEL